MNKRKNAIIVGPILVLAFLFLIVGIVYFGKKDGNNEPLNSQYRISDNHVEYPGSETIKSDKLTQEHCLDNICVKDVVIYQAENEGRIEYTIVNKGSSEASDILKLNFGDTFTYITFTILQPGRSVSSRTIFRDGDYTNVDDYTLEYLTAEEKEKIVRH